MRHDPTAILRRSRRPKFAWLALVAAVAGGAAPATAQTPVPQIPVLDYTTGTVSISVVSPFSEQLHYSREPIPQREFGQEFVLAIFGGLDVFGVAATHADSDPAGRWTIRATNPLSEPIALRFALTIPTIRMRADAWRAEARLDATLGDGNGNGASLLPLLDTYFHDPLAPPVKQIMDTGVALVVGTTTFFGGAPSEPLGMQGLVAAAGGEVSRSWSSSASMLPDHTWIGPDVAWNTLNLQVGFTLSAGDSVDISARFDITPIPEPQVWSLFGLGLLLVRVLARRPKGGDALGGGRPPHGVSHPSRGQTHATA